jgi:predicted RNase H-like nuclease
VKIEDQLNTRAIGIDGCPGGWIAALLDTSGQMKWRLEPNFENILAGAATAELILVDMIIGLPCLEIGVRECDRLARVKLRPHASRVFNAPVREVLGVGSYSATNLESKRVCGKGLSKQSYYLFPKIRELDACTDLRVRESHPELVFARLNGGIPVSASKKTEAGREARLRILEDKLPSARAYYEIGMTLFKRAKVGRDDLLDAMVLCVAAMEPEALQSLPEGAPPCDEQGHMMQIWF